MAEAVEPQAPLEAPLDVKAFMAARNEGKEYAAPVVEPPKEELKPVVPADDDDTDDDTDDPAAPSDDKKAAAPPAHISRSQRREMNRLREQAAEERGRRMAMEDFMKKLGIDPDKPTAPAKPKEIVREDFATDADFTKAVATHAAKQEVEKATAQSEADQGLVKRIEEARVVRTDHEALIPDWKDVLKKSSDLNFNGSSALPYLFATSKWGAFVTEMLVKEPALWEELLSHNKDDIEQRAFFHQLEGQAKVVYNSRKAAQASEADKLKEDRNDSANGQPGRDGVSTSQKAPLPKPSSEVSVRGGAAPPGDPKPGTKAWMDRRNAEKSARV